MLLLLKMLHGKLMKFRKANLLTIVSHALFKLEKLKVIPNICKFT